jgi:hypothetical protein
MDGGFPEVTFSGQDVMLSNTGGQFQFAVVDITLGVIKGDQSPLNVLLKKASPQVGLYQTIELGHKVNTAHVQRRSILGPQGVRLFLGYKFSYADWSASQVLC